MTDEGFEIVHRTSEDGETLALSGAATLETVTRLRAGLRDSARPELRVLDLADLRRMDTAGAWAVADFERHQQGAPLALRNASAEIALLLETVRSAMPRPKEPSAARNRLLRGLDKTGRQIAAGLVLLRELTGYLGLFLVALGRSLRHPRRFPFTALVAQADETGVRAVPIVLLMSFLIGVVLAFQGATQLRQFGAEVFVVDLIAISVLRELGILLTAIIVAGRTASAFTAAIGSMKMREEIDAMRTLGLDPATVLFLPRILALLITLPILGLVSNLAGLLGGALMSWIELGISPSMFRNRLLGTDLAHVLVGMVKAPVFALIIGVVGCHAGMQVGGNAESLGRMTSNAVVTAIFAVIAADALFSIFFAQVGL